MRYDHSIAMIRENLPVSSSGFHDHPVARNRLAEAPLTSAPHQIWVGDINYIPTDQGWLYLAGVVPLHTRSIVGLAMGPSIDSGILLSALAMAMLHRQPQLGMLFHSDRGVQYAARDSRAALAAADLVPFMCRRGNCYDNASMETFWNTLRLELVYRGHFATHRQAQGEIFDFIEVFYNRQRRHTSIGGLLPTTFELNSNSLRIPFLCVHFIATGQKATFPGSLDLMSAAIYVLGSVRSAGRQVRFAVAGRLDQLTKPDLVRAWCSRAHILPRLNLNGVDDAGSGWQRTLKRIPAQAWRGTQSGELFEEKLYPSDSQWSALYDRMRNHTPDERARRMALAVSFGHCADA